MENETDAKKPLQLAGRRFEMKKTVETGQVRQQFPHGRQKTVQVEIKRKRSVGPSTGGGPALNLAPAKPAPAAAPAAPPPAAAAAPAAPPSPPPAPSPSISVRSDDGRSLTQQERVARVKALQEALKDEEERRRAQVEEARRRAVEEERRRTEETEKRRLEEEEARKRTAEEGERRRREEEEARRKTADDSKGRPGEAAPAGAETDAARAAAAAKRPALRLAEEDEAGAARRAAAKRTPTKAEPSTRRTEDRRRSGKMTITQALTNEENERVRSLASVRRAREREKMKLLRDQMEQQKFAREVVVPEAITVQELANRMAERGANVIKALMKLGVMVTINQVIDADTAELVITEFGHKIRRVAESDVEIGMRVADDDPTLLHSRPPVVTIMGHVDHGKTSLLDALRATDVAAHEAGGITQHIGAYQLTMSSGKKITFIDTPGHAAFTEMRARGANVTDIVVLVVAADDGIMQQTVEAIRHAQAAKVPIIVAINKIDKPEANAQRVRNELLAHDIQVEALGGQVLDVEVSAKQKINLDKLEETIVLQAELMDLKANPTRMAEGTIVEARLEKGRGSVATVLIQRGTLKVGDIFVAGAEWGRVRALADDRGGRLDEAGPSTPVEVVGLQGTPLAGDDFVVVNDETRARDIASFRQRKRREKEAAAAAGSRGTLDQMFAKIQAGEARELPIVVKSDVQGSLEAIIGSLSKLATDEVKVRVLHSAVGGVNESDVTLAKASAAAIIGFNVRANPQARDMARRDGVDIRYYSIIYNVVDDIKALLSGMLAPTVREQFLGNVEIRKVFNITKVGKVAGCMVVEGKVVRGAKVRILRDNVVIHEGKLKSLKRLKDEVREVLQGFECGMAFETFQDLQEGDVVECFEVEEVARQL
ncbi:MAG: translation initiation factor IF-2 [Alphaproteobacteria bacterium]|nr:translation initiation factor IF-2 [Alphaproteobacteria bacterium]